MGGRDADKDAHCAPEGLERKDILNNTACKMPAHDVIIAPCDTDMREKKKHPRMRGGAVVVAEEWGVVWCAGSGVGGKMEYGFEGYDVCYIISVCSIF